MASCLHQCSCRGTSSNASETILCSPALRIGRRANKTFFGQRLDRSGMIAPGRKHHPQSRSRSTQVVKAAIFGVGAPEALLVGVVALVVFGPKGLAQAVKSLGATLRTFSPTIRELASVTNDLSSTLQEQIGLDDIRNEFRNPPPSYYRDGASKEASASSSEQSEATAASSSDAEDMATEDLEAKIEESKRMAWGGQMPQAQSDEGSQGPPDQPGSTESTKTASELSIEELEAELKRRRSVASNSQQ